jgi:signal transduction histidine kinase
VLKDEFFSTITHELRTPLTSVLGYADLLLDDEADSITDEQGKFRAVIHRNAERLLRLVDDLLFVARADAGRLDMCLEQTELVALAREAIEARRPSAETLALDLRFTNAVDCAWVAADPGRLGQAIDNLLSNAVKFTPSGGKVELALTETEGQALLTVSDTGMGMTEAEISRTFERFFRTNAAQANGIQGTGLGLTITKAIVEAHDGTITVRSTPNVGTSFVIELPLLDPLATPRLREPLALAEAEG